MRTTIDLPPLTHQQVRAVAAARHQSVSSTVADLVALGLAALGEPATISRDPVSGLPVMSIGRRLTSDDVADLLDEE